jgi:hypothetical protein
MMGWSCIDLSEMPAIWRPGPLAGAYLRVFYKNFENDPMQSKNPWNRSARAAWVREENGASSGPA